MILRELRASAFVGIASYGIDLRAIRHCLRREKWRTCRVGSRLFLPKRDASLDALSGEGTILTAAAEPT